MSIPKYGLESIKTYADRLGYEIRWKILIVHLLTLVFHFILYIKKIWTFPFFYLFIPKPFNLVRAQNF